jgi:hypothetical protein
MTESGDGSLVALAFRCTGALIRDSAEELRCLDTDLDPMDVVEGRRGEFALMSCSGIDAWPSSPGIDASSWSNAASLVLVFGCVNESVVDAGVGFAETARSRARGFCGPRALVGFLVACAFFCCSSKLSSVDNLAVTTSVNAWGFGFDF